MANMATFCLNIFRISHLQNLSAYEILYGRKPPAISNLQLEGDDLTRPAFYRFTDYHDLLNERIHAIRDIVKENHNQTIEKSHKSTVLRVYLSAHLMRGYSLLSLSIKNYYLGPKTAVQETTNAICKASIHFLKT